ncbi:aldo/keto reductase family oxidoreductase [Celerinatantimonas sp. MCCC 1A17872]|uniref:aldo/keto reductase n=1 Tax=Celerinatantimonas sp. MCCC 1A17872 TaxID=3177514 RepID=UPI0038CB3454
MRDLALSTTLADVSPIAFGCMGLGGDKNATTFTASDRSLAQQCIEIALEEGINFFDHADIYCNGRAEQIFGQVLKDKPSLREQIYIQSKCGIYLHDEIGPQRYDLSYEHIIQSVEGSLARLQCDYLDILLLHRPDPLMEPEEIARAFTLLKEQGKVHHFGVSNMHAGQIKLLQNFIDEPLVVNQVELNLAHRDFIETAVTVNDDQGLNHNFNEGLLEYCQLNGIQVQAWSPLAKGLFAKEPQDAAIAAAQERLDEYAREYNGTRESILLAWLMRHPGTIQPVIGTTNAQRIRACAKAADIELTRLQWYLLLTDVRGRPIP